MHMCKSAEFERLARDNMDALYTRAIRIARTTAQAEALVQSTFSHAYSRFDTYDYSIGFRDWLFKILEMKSGKRNSR
ncbi:hypothetical protein JW998_06875 [candidate division KSB1 bacterium]|nr:hypothetical protein [candidate division KSB1 bacterium]